MNRKAETTNVIVGFEVKLGLESQPHHLMAVHHWTIHLTILSVLPQRWNEIGNTCFRFVRGNK